MLKLDARISECSSDRQLAQLVVVLVVLARLHEFGHAVANHEDSLFCLHHLYNYNNEVRALAAALLPLNCADNCGYPAARFNLAVSFRKDELALALPHAQLLDRRLARGFL